MNCDMTQGVYLRANGELICYCGAGATITLGKMDFSRNCSNFYHDYYLSPPFRHIRESFMRGCTPFPGVCDQCGYLDLREANSYTTFTRKLRWLHWEPSAACNLKCEWCDIPPGEYSYRGNFTIPLEAFTRIVDSFHDEGFRLEKATVAGAGEPTLNPAVWKQIAYARKRLGGHYLMSTNGNTRFKPEIIDCGLDVIKIAIDGLDQTTYARYRKGGSLDKVIELTRNISREKVKRKTDNPEIRWQYIVFNYNDSTEELVRLQERALELGVNSIRIVYTRCKNYSLSKPGDFPKVHPDIEFLKIKEESLITLKKARKTIDSIASTGGSKHEQAMEIIGLINDIYKRLSLGVKNYAELYRLTSKVDYNRSHAEGKAPLSRENFNGFLGIIRESYEELIRLYREMGNIGQSRKYENYLQAVKLERAA